MDPIFQVLFIIGFLIWIAIDFRKIKQSKSKSMMAIFVTINMLTLLLFFALFMQYRPPTPVSLMNNTVYYWVKAWTGGIYYVTTGH